MSIRNILGFNNTPSEVGDCFVLSESVCLHLLFAMNAKTQVFEMVIISGNPFLCFQTLFRILFLEELFLFVLCYFYFSSRHVVYTGCISLKISRLAGT